MSNAATARDAAIRAANEAAIKAKAEAQENYLKERRLEQLKTDPLGGLRFMGAQIPAFKVVKCDGRSFQMCQYTRTHPKYEVGAILTETNFNADEDEDCGAGLNVATLPWILSNLKGEIERGGARVLRVVHSAADIVAIPFATQGKYRVKKLFVEADITQDLIDAGLIAGTKTQDKTPAPGATVDTIRLLPSFAGAKKVRARKVLPGYWAAGAILDVIAESDHFGHFRVSAPLNRGGWGNVSHYSRAEWFEPVEVIQAPAAAAFTFDGRYQTGDVIRVLKADDYEAVSSSKEYTLTRGLGEDADVLINDDNAYDCYLSVADIVFVRRPNASAGATAANDNTPIQAGDKVRYRAETTTWTCDRVQGDRLYYGGSGSWLPLTDWSLVARKGSF